MNYVDIKNKLDSFTFDREFAKIEMVKNNKNYEWTGFFGVKIENQNGFDYIVKIGYSDYDYFEPVVIIKDNDIIDCSHDEDNKFYIVEIKTKDSIIKLYEFIY